MARPTTIFTCSTCGAQTPALNFVFPHNPKPDAKLGTPGDIGVVKFP